MSDGDDARVDGVGVGELVSGMAGNGGTAVCVLIALFTSISAITRATASSTATPAKINNQRGDFGPPGGGGARPSGGSSPDGGTPCCQYGGSCLVGLVSFRLGAYGGIYPPYVGA